MYSSFFFFILLIPGERPLGQEGVGLGKGTGKARVMPGTLNIQENPSLETSLGQPAALGSKHRRLCEPVSASPVPEAPRDWSCHEGAFSSLS